ncbi:hypothetical protein PILCRDRAFT_829575 [Piloderma croceum F 1598]|uniref:Protein kinase domain-containing protein n=1 Tax=Piloderma croceum (strain F 1598) TaxID=765440 RepID=A0A0C3B640_PILCF|nr:hypothetical protein PILCRDRAFT_829575 [Piloderma croceum F 1598]
MSARASTEDPGLTCVPPTHEPINLLPPQIVTPIPRLSHVSFDIVECIKHSRHQDGVFRVRANINGRRQDAILKLFHLDDPPRDFRWKTGKDLFDTERRAYANLIHYNLCDDGLVPQCYGFADFPNWNPAIGCPPNPMPNQPDPWKFFRDDVKSPMALFLEYFPDMEHLGFYNFTADAANITLSILTRIHEAHILHYDFVPRNILVSSSGRVVVVDFGDVVIHPDDTAVYVGEISQFMYGEYADAWSMFFEHMMPDIARMRQGKAPETLLGRRWLTTDQDMSWMIEE